MKKLVRFIVGILTIAFGLNTVLYGISFIHRPSFIFPWGTGIIAGGAGLIALGIFFLAGKTSIREHLEDIF